MPLVAVAGTWKRTTNMFWHIIELAGVRSLVPDGEAIPADAVVIGQTADPTYLAAPAPRVMTKLEFRRLFTLGERIAIDNAPDNPDLPAQVRGAMRTMLSDLALAEQVHLDDADVIAGVNAMATFGLITAERAAQVLG